MCPTSQVKHKYLWAHVVLQEIVVRGVSWDGGGARSTAVSKKKSRKHCPRVIGFFLSGQLQMDSTFVNPPTIRLCLCV